jgi:hypothetical protein
MDEWLAAVEADKRDVPLPMKIIDTKRAAGVTEGCVAADGIDAPLSLCDATVDQQATLREAFPTGVCDYSKPGTGFQVAVPWLTYQDAGARSSTAERRWASPAVDVLPGLNRLWTGGLLPARSGPRVAPRGSHRCTAGLVPCAAARGRLDLHERAR